MFHAKLLCSAMCDICTVYKECEPQQYEACEEPWADYASKKTLHMTCKHTPAASYILHMQLKTNNWDVKL